MEERLDEKALSREVPFQRGSEAGRTAKPDAGLGPIRDQRPQARAGEPAVSAGHQQVQMHSGGICGCHETALCRLVDLRGGVNEVDGLARWPTSPFHSCNPLGRPESRLRFLRVQRPSDQPSIFSDAPA